MGTETWDSVRSTQCAGREGTVVFLQLWDRTAWLPTGGWGGLPTPGSVVCAPRGCDEAGLP